MNTILELRFLFVLGIAAIAVAALGLDMLAQRLVDRVARGRAGLAASRFREARVDRSRQRLEHELGARSARWQMLV